MTDPSVPPPVPPSVPPAGAAAPPAATPAEPQPLAVALQFTGSGGEYFRIWIVNLVLTILTLGIYSAWAKVRKVRYFMSNTRLHGAAFQYHARPGAILRGRILVGLLFVAYSLLGRISIAAGLAAATVLGLLAPWFIFKALRFKLSNTSWRGVRFGFASTPGRAYAVLLPAVILWLAFIASAPQPRVGEQPSFGAFGFVALLVFVLYPYFHARLKEYQHGSTTFGRQTFQFERSVGAFYGLYGKTFAVGACSGVFFAALLLGFGSLLRTGAETGQPPVLQMVVFGSLLILVLYLPAGAFFMARLQALVWDRTSGGPFRFSNAMGARRFAWLLLKNGFLTLVTVGLYWPWAAIDLSRYQIQCLIVHTIGPLEAIAAGDQPVEGSAAGDSAVDYMGWDFGW
jgi:uncharacterized membrane protein YjgN (DUF898 family)